MVCGNFILPEPASYVFFYAIFNLRKLLYIIGGTARRGCGFSPHRVGLRIRGIFSHVREYPPWTPKRTQGALPFDPAIAGLQLEGLHALRSVGAVYMASP